jgi:hypothetical protein
MSENLTLLKQRAAEDQTKHTEAVKEANARRAIATKELSIEMANLATSILVKHFGDLAVANLTVSQKSVNRLVDVLAFITHVEGFYPEFDFDFSVEGVHLSATARANLTGKSYESLRLFHDKREVSVEDVLAVLPPESKSAIAIKTRLAEAKAAEEKRLQELSDRRTREVESLKASIVESVKNYYGVNSVDVEDLEASDVTIVIDGKRFEAKVQNGAVTIMYYAYHFMVYSTDTLIKALDGTFDAELAEATKAAEATKVAPARQRRFFRR